MKNKSTIYAIIAVVFVGVLIFIASDGRQPDKNGIVSVASASAFSVVDNKFDFGTIAMKDGKVTHDFEVKNTGSEPIVINKVYTSCGCTEASASDAQGNKYGTFGMQGHRGLVLNTNIEVKPGESATVTGIFDPAAHGPQGTGLARRMIYLETNSKETPKVQLDFSANVIN